MSVWLWLVTYNVSIPAISPPFSCQPPDPLADERGDPFLRLGEQPPGLAAGDRALDRLADHVADLEPPLHSRPLVARELARAQHGVGDVGREAVSVVRGADDGHPRGLRVTSVQGVGADLLRRGGELDELPGVRDVPSRRWDSEHGAVEAGVARPRRPVRDRGNADR